RTGSWEQFHHHIQWSKPPRPTPAPPPPVVQSAQRVAKSPLPGPREGSGESGPSLTDLLINLWQGFCCGF
ncbi:MAG: hypothetical protein ACKO0M_15535, partial [Cyanobium sp.]